MVKSMADTLYYTFPFFHQRYFANDGNPLAGGSLTFYSAGSTVLKPIYLDQSGVQAANPLPLDSTGLPIKQYFGEAGEYDIYVKDSNGVIIDKKLRIAIASTATGGTSDHKLLIESTDPVAGYLFDKIVPGPFTTIGKTAGSVGEAIEITAAPVVSANGNDIPNYLINKLSCTAGDIDFSVVSGKVNLALDYASIKSNLTNSPYAVWWSGSNGSLVGSTSFTFGDPSRQAALFAPSIQASGSMIIGSAGNAFWDEDTFYLSNASTGSIVELTSGWSNTKYIYAHNNQGTASVVTDKASFANLANHGLVFAAELPNTSEDLIYLHTATGLTFDPTTNILTAPKISTPALNLSTLTVAGVLVNDASGNVSTVPTSTFVDDHLLLVSSLDTTPGYLGTKLAAGTNIGFSVTSDSHGQKLWISARSNMLLNPTYISANYTVTDTDTCIVNYASGSITLTMPAPDMTYNGRGIEIFNASPEIMYVVGGITFSAMMNFGMKFRCVRDYTQTWVWIQVG